MIALDEVIAAIGLCIQSEDDFEDGTAQVADRLLEFVGPPSANGVNEGSDAKLKEVADAAKERFKSRARRFSFDYLRQLRRTAFKFPAGERSTAVPFSLMIVARDPATLHAAIAQAEQDGRQCSANFIRKFRKVKENRDDDEDKSSTAFVRLRETQRRMIDDARFYNKATGQCSHAACECSNEDKHALASAGRDLIRAVNQFVWAIEPTPIRQAAE